MNSNFCFLKKIDNDLYSIIIDAEKLYRDEYFDQCITQTRKFGENICKKTLGYSCETFDATLATLKDKMRGTAQEKEFIEDLYFLKKHGNSAVHSSIKNDAILALECLQRSFETALSYSVYIKKAKDALLKRRFDTELLITGKKSSKSLSQKYEEEKEKVYKTKSFTKHSPQKTSSNGRQSSAINSETEIAPSIPAFWVVVIATLLISFVVMVYAII